MTVAVEVRGHVGVIELRRPPHNFLSPAVAASVADALEMFDADPEVRVAVLAAQGRSFCAGMEFHDDGEGGEITTSFTEQLYAEAVRLCAVNVPVIAAVQGPAIGGGLDERDGYFTIIGDNYLRGRFRGAAHTNEKQGSLNQESLHGISLRKYLSLPAFAASPRLGVFSVPNSTTRT